MAFYSGSLALFHISDHERSEHFCLCPKISTDSVTLGTGASAVEVAKIVNEFFVDETAAALDCGRVAF